MKTARNLSVVAGGLVVCLILVWFSVSIHGSEITYELKPEIGLPEYKSDAARAIDAYERMIDRYLTLTERSLAAIDRNGQLAVRKLDCIDSKLTKLSARMARIEQALGIQQPVRPAKKNKENPKAGTFDSENRN